MVIKKLVKEDLRHLNQNLGHQMAEDWRAIRRVHNKVSSEEESTQENSTRRGYGRPRPSRAPW